LLLNVLDLDVFEHHMQERLLHAVWQDEFRWDGTADFDKVAILVSRNLRRRIFTAFSPQSDGAGQPSACLLIIKPAPGERARRG